MRIPFICLTAAGAIALGGCTYGGLGLGYGYGDYGYGGYGYGYPYGGYYGSPYYSIGYGSRYYRYGGYYGSPYWGWYDNFYYPGTGIYVYDSYRRPRIWTESQKRYWSSRRPAVTTTTRTTTVRPNWSGFNRERAVRTSRVTFDRPSRSERLQQAQERRIERQTTRSNRARVRPVTRPD